ERYSIEFEKLDISLLVFLQKRSSASPKLEEIRPIVQQLAIALDFLEEAGIVHADLKPENIMMVDHVWQALKIKVIDFGLAVNNSAEQILLGNVFNGTIDCTAAQMLTSSVLFPGIDEYNMIEVLAQEKYDK
ncbi:Homeodomain-interacting protein kinase 1, partial [Dissostichus eleginoides]